ncbi:MAG TPA: metallophosphoesterase [Clostridia bacterium]|nr:metallophosphoesterase [Clostridia bacterium]
MVKRIFSVLLIVILAFSISVIGTGVLYTSTPANKEKDIRRLEFTDNEFTILQLTDFHEWAGIEGSSSLEVEIQNNLKPALIKFINKALDDTKPDFVVVTGDNIFPLSFIYDFLENVSIKTIGYLGELFEQRKQPWTLTFGNHDTESGVKKEDFFEALLPYQYFIGPPRETDKHKNFIQTMDDSSKSNLIANFSIPIFDGNTVGYNIYVLDSGSHYSPKHSYLPITKEQTDWYTSEFNRLKTEKGEVVPAIMFTHIPLLEMFEYVYNGAIETFGRNGGISPSFEPSPLFNTIMQNKDVKGIFFGHNHESSIAIFAKENNHKLLMAITPSAEAESYLVEDAKMHGRIVKLKTDGSFETYVYTLNEASESSVLDDLVLNYD